MSRYIDAEKIEFHAPPVQWKFREYIAIQSEVDAIPEADVEPVRHGRWIFGWSDQTNNYFVCSECRERIKNPSYETTEIVKIRFPYSHCGAKMDGEEER